MLEECIELTPAENGKMGCAWNKTPIDFTHPFNLSLDYNFGSSINGADGTTFTFLPVPEGCGDNGSQIGAGNLPNALVVEFDTYDNDYPYHDYDMAEDHISIVTSGDLQDVPLCGPVTALPSGANIDDGIIRKVKITWDPATQQLSVYLADNLRLTCTNDFITNVFNGATSIYWGATAATGGLNNLQYFCPNTVVLPTKLNQFTSECQDNVHQLYWKNEDETGIDYYTLEYTYDGMVYYPIATIDAQNNDSREAEYRYPAKQKTTQQQYYRLTSYNMDGKEDEQLTIIGSNCTQNNTPILAQILQNEHEIALLFNQTNQLFQLFDINGKEMTSILSNEESTKCTVVNTFTTGMYFLKVWNQTHTQLETHKIVITH